MIQDALSKAGRSGIGRRCESYIKVGKGIGSIRIVAANVAAGTVKRAATSLLGAAIGAGFDFGGWQCHCVLLSLLLQFRFGKI